MDFFQVIIFWSRKKEEPCLNYTDITEVKRLLYSHVWYQQQWYKESIHLHDSDLTFVETLQMCLPSTLDSLSKIPICFEAPVLFADMGLSFQR